MNHIKADPVQADIQDVEPVRSHIILCNLEKLLHHAARPDLYFVAVLTAETKCLLPPQGISYLIAKLLKRGRLPANLPCNAEVERRVLLEGEIQQFHEWQSLLSGESSLLYFPY